VCRARLEGGAHVLDGEGAAAEDDHLLALPVDVVERVGGAVGHAAARLLEGGHAGAREGARQADAVVDGEHDARRGDDARAARAADGVRLLRDDLVGAVLAEHPHHAHLGVDALLERVRERGRVLEDLGGSRVVTVLRGLGARGGRQQVLEAVAALARVDLRVAVGEERPDARDDGALLEDEHRAARRLEPRRRHEAEQPRTDDDDLRLLGQRRGVAPHHEPPLVEAGRAAHLRHLARDLVGGALGRRGAAERERVEDARRAARDRLVRGEESARLGGDVGGAVADGHERDGRVDRPRERRGGLRRLRGGRLRHVEADDVDGRGATGERGLEVLARGGERGGGG